MNLYCRCEKEGVGISAMKAFSGGQLLDAKTSPFGKALTEYQCIQYALDKPGVLTVLPGIRNKKDLHRILGFCKASEAEKGLCHSWNLCTSGCRRCVCILQSLPAMSGRTERGSDEQVLRFIYGGRSSGL